MSAISKIYKEYGESTGKQYLSLWYSTMIAMGGMKSVEHQKEYAVRAQQYIRKEYGEDFWNDYNTFFRDYNRSDALIKELLKNKAAFVIKYLTVDLVREIVEGASSKKPVQAPGNNRPASVSKPAAVPVPQQNRNIVERKVVKKRETDYGYGPFCRPLGRPAGAVLRKSMEPRDRVCRKEQGGQAGGTSRRDAGAAL